VLTPEQREAIYRWRRRRGQSLDDYHLDDELDEQRPRRVDSVSHREQHAAGGLVVIDPVLPSESQMAAIVVRMQTAAAATHINSDRRKKP
jgi:hypothetical protein